MIIFIAALLILIAFSSRLSIKDFNGDYISRDGINGIKGIFVILILLSHAKGYFTPDAPLDKPYMMIQNHIGQMVVALFLFYSGYGIMEQIKKRGFDYIMTIPKKRFPSLLLNFDLAVILYIILGLILGNSYTPLQLLYGFTAWEGIGNSSWYIFVTFALYLLVFLCFLSIKAINNKQRYIYPAIVFCVMTVLLMIGIKAAGKDTWWYNTAHLFPLGMLYSYFKDRIEKAVMKNNLTWCITLAVLISGWIVSRHFSYTYYNMYYAYGIMFTLSIVIITMKLKVDGKVLNWFGKHIFSIYILQRIPMIVLSRLGLADFNGWLFTALSIAITVPLAAGFDYLTGKLNKLIWKK